MNINYEKGNVIASQTSFNDYKFPAQLPTEEWAGDEVRSYFNYIRPVANLFENDRENLNFSKEIIDSLIYKENNKCVVDGCTISKVVKNSNYYYEVGEGIFLNKGNIYHIFPACEAVAKQIKKEYIEEARLDVDIKIWYDDVNKKYNYKYITEDGVYYGEGQTETASDLIYTLLNGIKVQSDDGEGSLEEESLFELGYKVEDHIILPIFKLESNSTVEIYFNNNTVSADDETFPESRTTLGNIVNGVVNYDNVKQFTIDGKYIQNETTYITIGSTRYNLRDTITDIDGVTHINGVNLYTDSSKLKIKDEVGHSITTSTNYTLGTACEKNYSDSTALDEPLALPTSAAIKAYVSNQIDNQTRTKKMNFSSGVEIAGGVAITSDGLSVVGDTTVTGSVTANNKLYIKSNAPASRTSGVLSMAASISTEGGIEAKGSIFSNGSVVGLNSGVYSQRKLKENITPFNESALDLIKDIDIVNFNYIADPEKNHKIGFIADDTHEYFSTKDHNIMDQANCIGLLLKAVQELAAENAELKEKLSHVINA